MKLHTLRVIAECLAERSKWDPLMREALDAYASGSFAAIDLLVAVPSTNAMEKIAVARLVELAQARAAAIELHEIAKGVVKMELAK